MLEPLCCEITGYQPTVLDDGIPILALLPKKTKVIQLHCLQLDSLRFLAGGTVLGYTAPADQYTCSFVLSSVFVDFLTGQEVGMR